MRPGSSPLFGTCPSGDEMPGLNGPCVVFIFVICVQRWGMLVICSERSQKAKTLEGQIEDLSTSYDALQLF